MAVNDLETRGQHCFINKGSAPNVPLLMRHCVSKVPLLVGHCLWFNEGRRMYIRVVADAIDAKYYETKYGCKQSCEDAAAVGNEKFRTVV